MTTLIERPPEAAQFSRSVTGSSVRKHPCTEAADEIEHLMLDLQTERAAVAALTQELANAKVSGIHSCHDGCTRSGCVAGRLRDALARVEVIMWHHSDEFPELRAVVQAALRATP